MGLIDNLGFSSPPFSKTNADEEPYLTDYFIPPPFFNSIVGDSAAPAANVVFAPRGAGKTAQRRMVERKGLINKFLPVTYDRFEFDTGYELNDISLSFHLRNIIIRILVSILSYSNETPDVFRKLSDEDKYQLSMFIQTYLGDYTGQNIQEIMKELKGLPEKLRQLWERKIGLFDSVVKYLLKNNSLATIDPEKVQLHDKKLTTTYKYQLETLLRYAQLLGFKSIYILIDKVDETEKTGNDPENSYILIKPILKDLELLGLSGYGFKLFLWDKIEPFYRTDARPDRITEYTLTWKRETLKKALTARLQYFSSGKVSNLSEIVDGVKGTEIVDDIVCLLANGSPRNMIRLSDRILAIQSEKEELNVISDTSVDQATVDFSEKLFKENYDEALLKTIQKLGKEIFTINFLASDILKITTQGARSKLKIWLNLGLVKQIGTVSGKASKPVNLYCIADPIAVRLIHRKENIFDFIDNRWLPCEYCDADNLVDINLYDDGADPACRDCGRDLV